MLIRISFVQQSECDVKGNKQDFDKDARSFTAAFFEIRSSVSQPFLPRNRGYVRRRKYREWSDLRRLARVDIKVVWLTTWTCGPRYW